MEVIKIELNNFKSYKGKYHVVDNIQEGANLVLGGNGAGKTNFFKAVKFVLTSKAPRSELQKRSLLYNSEDTTASVKIVLKAKTPRRGNIGQDWWITIERVFSLKNDYFLLNGIRVTEKDIFNRFMGATGLLDLESIHYVSNEMTKELVVTTPEKRMEVLLSRGLSFLHGLYGKFKSHETALESMNEKIHDFMNTMAETLKEFEEETEKCVRCRNLLIKKSLLQIAIHHRNTDKLLKKQKKIRHELSQQMKAVCEDKLIKTEKKIERKAFEEKIIRDKNEFEIKSVIFKELTNEKEELLKTREQLILTIEDEENRYNRLTDLNNEIAIESHPEDELVTKIQLKSELETQFLQMKTNLSEKEVKRTIALSEIENAGKHSEQEQRRIHADKIQSLTEKMDDVHTRIKSFSERKMDLQNLKCALTTEKENNEKEFLELKKMKEQEKKAKVELNLLQAKLNEKRRVAIVSETQIIQFNKSLHLKKLALLKTLGSGITRGIESVEKVLRQWERAGLHSFTSRYYGLVIDNVTFNDPNLILSVEKVAGKRLFYHIVEDPDVSNKILKEMEKNSMPGEVFFLPLKTLRVRQYKTGKMMTLLQHLQYSAMLEKAMRFIFGGALLCYSLDEAANVAKEFKGHICVTVEGDLVLPNGAISGGYLDPRLGNISIYAGVKEIKQNLTSTEKDLTQTNEEINEILTSINKVQSFLQILGITAKENCLKLKQKRFDAELLSVANEISCLDHHISIMTSQSAELQLALEELKEKKTPVGSVQLKSLNQDIFALTKEYNLLSTDLEKLTHEIDLLRRAVDHKKKFTESKEEVKDELKVCAGSIDELKTLLASVDGRLEQIQNKLEDAQPTTVLFEPEMESLEEPQVQNEDRTSLLENRLNRVNSEIAKEFEDMNAIIFTLQSENTEIDKYFDYPLEQLFTKLEKTVKSLAKIPGNVQVLSSQKLGHNLKPIKNIQKDSISSFVVLCFLGTLVSNFLERIDFSIKCELSAISSKFGDYFQAITDGKGSATLQYNKMKSADLEVKFLGEKKVDDMTSLSGGQKMTVLLSLVMSILEIQDIQFCTFDEIDRNLSPEVMSSFMNVLRRVPNKKFLFSSHSKGMAKLCKAFFAVSHVMGSSSIAPISVFQAERNLSLLMDESNKTTESSSSKNSWER